ncbi:MAG: DUF2924 domain-containing protein [Roseiarcus sp.]
MTISYSRRLPARLSAAADLDAELGRVAAMTIDQLRDLWREARGRDPPQALTKDMIARALAHFLQDERLGGLRPRLRKLLASLSAKSVAPMRHLKAGSVIVREYQGKVHEVTIVPDGFCWQGKVYASLSTIARKMTGTSWNGPRFFGLRGGEPAPSTAAAREPTQPRKKALVGSKSIQSNPSTAERVVSDAGGATAAPRFARPSALIARSRRSSERPEGRP